MGMIQCNNCGSLLPDPSRFCGSCGQLVSAFTEKGLDAPTIATSSENTFITFISEANLKTVISQPVSSPHSAPTQGTGPNTPIDYNNSDIDQFFATEMVGRLPTAPLPRIENEQENKDEEEKRRLYLVMGMGGAIAELNALPNQMQVPMAQTPLLEGTPYVQGTPDLGGAIGGPGAPRIEGAMPQQGFSTPPQTPGGANAVQDMHGGHTLQQQAYPQQTQFQQPYSPQGAGGSNQGGWKQEPWDAKLHDAKGQRHDQQQHQNIYGEASQGLNFLKGLLPIGGSLILIGIIIISILTLAPTFASGPPRLIIVGGTKPSPGALVAVRGEKFIPGGMVSFTVNGAPIARNAAAGPQLAVAGLLAPLLSDGEPSSNVHLAHLSTIVKNDGTFEADILLPAQVPANGRYIIEALEQSGQETAKASLEVTVEQLPTKIPTKEPTPTPTTTPTPTKEPTVKPTVVPTPIPTKEPTVKPTVAPTPTLTVVPTPTPTKEPTVVPVSPPCVNVAPAELTFSQQEGKTGPQSQTFTITNCGKTGAISVSKDASWLNISTGSLTLNEGAKGEMTVTASGNGLPVGSHTSQITVKSDTAVKTVKVVLTITTAPTCSLTVSNGPLDFTMDQGGTNPGAKSIQVAGQNCNSGEKASIAVKTDQGGNWLSVNATSVPLNAGNQNVSVSMNGSGLNAGKYTGRVVVTQGATTRTVEVVLTVASVTPKECLNVTPANVKLEATSGQKEPVGVDLRIENCSDSTSLVKEAVTQGADWLSTDSTSVEISARSSGNVIIRASALNLAPGTYPGEVQFTVGALTRTVKVTFIVAEQTKPTCSLNISKDALNFTTEVGKSPAPQTVAITSANCGADDVAGVSVIQEGTWLGATPTSVPLQAGSNTITVSINGKGFCCAADATGQVKVKWGVIEKTIQVTLAVTEPAPPPAPCTVQVDPAFLDLTSVPGDPPVQATVKVILTNCGETAVTVHAETVDGGTWLQARLEGNVLIVTVNSAGLEPGPHPGSVTVTAGSASDEVTVDFLVQVQVDS